MECHCLSTVGVAHPYSSSLSCSRIPSFQGASIIGCKLPKSSPLPSSFLPLKFEPAVYQKKLSFHSLRSYKGRIRAEKQGWDVGRFWKTLSFFDQLPSPGKLFAFLIEKLSDPSPSRAVKRMDTSGIVLVAGATGGVGRRVVDLLRKNGRPVRVLVRNEEKARKMLGEDVDLVLLGSNDLRKRVTLLIDTKTQRG